MRANCSNCSNVLLQCGWEAHICLSQEGRKPCVPAEFDLKSSTAARGYGKLTSLVQ